MNHYMKKILPHLMAGHFDGALLDEQLYNCYRELHPCDTEAILRDFAALDHILRKLPLKEHDKVWDLTCRLCGGHEQAAFLEGLRTGIHLCLDPEAENLP